MVNRGITLLVHAGAPTTKAHDDICRAQARSLLASSFRRVPSPDVGRIVEDQLTIQRELPRDETTIFEEDTQNAFTALESQLYPSHIEWDDGINNHPSSQPFPVQNQQPSQSALRPSTPVNDEEDNSIPTHSSYLVSPDYLCAPVPHRSSTSSDERRAASQVSSSIDRAQRPAGQVSRESATGSSELPTSYSLSNVTTESSQATGQQLHQAHNEPTSTTSNEAHTAETTGAPDEAGQGSSRSHQDQDQAPSSSNHAPEAVVKPALNQTNPVASVPTTSHFLQRTPLSNHLISPRPQTEAPSATRPTPSASIQATCDFSQMPFSIHSPEPAVGIEPFTTAMTPHLAFLSNHEINATYKPVSTSRALVRDERGVWDFTVPSASPTARASSTRGTASGASPWPIEEQLSFWTYLGRAVTSGAVGWGVWCRREEVGSEVNCLGHVRVFCWGEIVRQVYLLLYVASNGRVRRLGLRWIDAGGSVVVQMPEPSSASDKGQSRVDGE